MSNYDNKKIRELFGRLFVLAIQNKINLHAFTTALERSKFIKVIEKDEFDDYLNKSIEQIFFDITQKYIDRDNSFGIYNDAYWCGYSYFELHQKTKKSFAFLFLKLPLSKMMDIYSIYHEMDFSSLLEYFYKLDQEKTILRALCEEKGCSLSRLSAETEISRATLSKYNASDEAIYKGAFQTIFTIATFFDVPLSIFLSV